MFYQQEYITYEILFWYLYRIISSFNKILTNIETLKATKLQGFN